MARLRALTGILPAMVAIEVAFEQKLYPWRPAKKHLGFESRTLFDKEFEQVPPLEQKRAVNDSLNELNPSAVVMAGYSEPAMRAAAIWAHRMHKVCVMTTTTTRFDRRRFLPKEIGKALWCRTYYDALCLPGERSVKYFEDLWFPRDRIWRCGNVVDNAFFSGQSDMVKENPERERRQRGLPQTYFLVVSRLSREKNLLRLLHAFQNYKQRGGKWALVIVGNGPQEADLKSFVEQHHVPAVIFHEWKQYDELPAYYGLASCFVLPSISEPWGLVVNEAMACGLPVLVSRHCGCVPELCRRGTNGFDFDPYDHEALASLMLKISGGEMDLKAMGEASRRFVANYTPETWALSLKDCVETMLAKSITD
jgi:1,2-diacylglycerol 3-alpha-glucosyltransferase